MILFEDGPAKGKMLATSRVPFLLRIAVDQETKECSALDSLPVKPRSWEKCYAYIMVRKFENDPKDGTPVAMYRLFEHQPPDVAFREAQKWSAWCMDMANGPGRPVAEEANINIRINGRPLPPMRKPVDEKPPSR